MVSSENTLVRETRIGAYGVCVNNGTILVVRKARGPYKGLYDLPGGGIEFGESPETALQREFIEEAGAQVVVGELAGAFSRVATFLSDSGTASIELHHIGLLYRVTWARPAAKVKSDPDGRDSLGATWLPLEEARPDVVSPLVVQGLSYIVPETSFTSAPS